MSEKPMDMNMNMNGNSGTGGAYTQLYWKASAGQLIRTKLEAYYNRWHAEMNMYPDNGNCSMSMPVPATTMLSIPDAQRTVGGFDVSDEIRLGNHWLLTPGIRLEYSRSSIFSPEGKDMLGSSYTANPDRTNGLYNAFIQMGYLPSPAFSLDLKLARGMRAPTLKESYALFLYNRVDGYDYLGNPHIKKEKSFNGELNFSYKRTGFNAAIKGFSYFFRDYIAGFAQPMLMFMTPGANGVKQFGNISSAFIAGASLLFNWNLTQKFSLISNATWQAGRDKDGNNLPMMSTLKSINTLSYQADRWHFFAEGIGAATQNKVSGFYGETRTPGFFIMNAGVDKVIAFHGQQIVLSVACNNIFNRYYYEHTDVIKLPEEGRNLILHITYDF
jgi:iron complex outermembrane receptor protein